MPQEKYRAKTICAAANTANGMTVLHFPPGTDIESLISAAPTRCHVPASLFPLLYEPYEPLTQRAPDLSAHFTTAAIPPTPGAVVTLHSPIIDAVAEVLKDGELPPEFSESARFVRPVKKSEILVRYASGLLRQGPENEVRDLLIEPR